ncbi:MAG TPA: twin-arginine translocation signal domain-containing protein [Coriobacteriia bacterium]|nr:twin-arginine translocation signal domain-containing protein [Coriobacteriia bacterium]
MATRDTAQGGGFGVSRRDFLKTTAAAAAAATCGLGFTYDPEKAAAYEGQANYTVTSTTCPYCSASCGQRVVKDNTTGKVVDLYGDFESPMNTGGLCAKGAGSLQLVNNSRRIGAYTGSHPVNNVFAADGTSNGVAYKRIGNGGWSAMPLQTAFDEIATGMVTARAADWNAANTNSKSVAFFGSSHINNEPNYVYRKLIANFGTSNTEHQARI